MEFYDPFDYYTGPSYSYPYYQRQAAPIRSRSSRGIFTGAEPAAAAKPSRRERDTKTSFSFSIPVHGPDSDPKPERKAAPAISAEQAAVRMQAAARGLLARKSVRAVSKVEREAEKMAFETEISLLAADPRTRAAIGEALMRMLLRLDAVRGAREYRRKVTKLVIALQDAVDALKTKPTPAVKMAEESAVAPAEIPDAAERGIEKTAVHAPTQMEFGEAVGATGKPEEEAGEQKDAVTGNANVDVDESEDSDAESEWEMVTDEKEHAAPVAAMSDDPEPPRKEPSCPFETAGTASTDAASDDVDVTKVMQMVVALCEENAKQCAVIGALAERVGALERTVRRMEDAESRRRQAKNMSTEGK